LNFERGDVAAEMRKKFSALKQSADYESAILKLQLHLSHNRISKSRHIIFAEATDLRPNCGLCRKPDSEFGNAPATEKNLRHYVHGRDRLDHRDGGRACVFQVTLEKWRISCQKGREWALGEGRV
jgi:hypothetical protein